jgi:acetylornithine/succinyldiaminopimelate/putrescine aminotransferase
MIKGFRSSGLLMAIDFGTWDLNKQIIDRCIAKGVFTDWFLFASHCMRLAPPLIISEEEIRIACKIILACCDEMQATL